MADDIARAWSKAFGATLGIVAGLELVILMFVFFSWVWDSSLPKLRVFEFKQFDEGAPAASEAPAE